MCRDVFVKIINGLNAAQAGYSLPLAVQAKSPGSGSFSSIMFLKIDAAMSIGLRFVNVMLFYLT
jgi:hypothetical protein